MLAFADAWIATRRFWRWDPQPIRKLDAQPKEKTVGFVSAIDGAAVAVLLDKAEELMTTGR